MTNVVPAGWAATIETMSDPGVTVTVAATALCGRPAQIRIRVTMMIADGWFRGLFDSIILPPEGMIVSLESESTAHT
jgi:hypothetical protein